MKPVLVNFSRHALDGPLAAALAAYHVIQVNPPGRSFGPGDAWRSIAAAAGWPDVVLIVMPNEWKYRFTSLLHNRLHASHVQIVECVMLDGDKATWSGRFYRWQYAPGGTWRIPWQPLPPEPFE